MKINKYITIAALSLTMIWGCEKGIDPITPVTPGADETAPVITHTAPTDGQTVKSADEVAAFTFKFVAEDDIELQSVKMKLDGTEINSITTFTDYRRAVVNYTYNGLEDGDHVFEVTATDLKGKVTTSVVNFKKITVPPYDALANEVLYLPFEDNLFDVISGAEAGKQGSPGFAEGKAGQALAGATDAYITYPSAGLTGAEFSVAFWYKINAVPDRAGILAISAPGDGRTTGFRMFREANGANQNIGLNIGTTSTEVWMNPFVTVPVDQDWIHIAIAISASKTTIYVNGEVVNETDLVSGIDWTGCTSLSLGSGAPNFTYWNHFSDLSLYDELHVIQRAITQEEVTKLYTVK